MAVKRYRITADVYTAEFIPGDEETLARLVREQLTRLCPLGVVEGYPDIQEIAQDSPFVEADETHD